ncbi:response regulator [Desulfurispirillum indicum]|uniref:hybrid sensor histidine kinase/response regulator n=1 Tax=Desulfurispirillum indicum TaxID=936456 RepID=UPI001CFAB3FF|nr:response regulator [Desulfurispirillum indicum]UCZ56135.1 response regulator [Desulfurispirillum indicum]
MDVFPRSSMPLKQQVWVALQHLAVFAALVILILLSTTHFRETRVNDYLRLKSEHLHQSYLAVYQHFQQLGSAMVLSMGTDEKLQRLLADERTAQQGDALATLLDSRLKQLRAEGFSALHFVDASRQPLYSFRLRSSGPFQVMVGDDSAGEVRAVPGALLIFFGARDASAPAIMLELPLESVSRGMESFYRGSFAFTPPLAEVHEVSETALCQTLPPEASAITGKRKMRDFLRSIERQMGNQRPFATSVRFGQKRYTYTFLPVHLAQSPDFLFHYEDDVYVMEYYHNYYLLVFLFTLIAFTVVLANFSRVRSLYTLRQQRDELARVGGLLKGTTDSMVEGLLMIDGSRRITYCNRAATLLLHATEQELLGRTPDAFFFHASSPWEVPQEIFCVADAVSDESMGTECEALVISDGGQRRYVSYITTPLQDGAGISGGHVMVFRDISQQKDDQERIRLLTEAFVQTDSMILITNHRGIIEYANQAFFAQTGYDREEVIGKSPRFPSPSVESEIWSVISAGQTWRGEMESRKKNGESYWTSMSVTPIKDTHGHVTHYVTVEEDMTERKAMEDALREAKNVAEEASRAKSIFLANMSHEIRTPMNGILGMTELALQTELSTTQRRYLTIAHNSAKSLLVIINDVLDFSKVEAGEIRLEQASFDPVETVENVMQSIAYSAYSKGIELMNHIDHRLSHYLVGDPTRLQQILNNLLGNAVKFTDTGHVLLDVEVQGESDSEAHLHFRVIDTGIGIPANKIDSIFESFSQVEASDRRKFGGTGLGLAITRKLVHLMNGRIWVESHMGEGSTFHFVIPFRKGDRLPDIPFDISAEQAARTRILVADDSEINRRILVEILERRQLGVVEAIDGDDARQKLQQAVDEGRPFDMLILDHFMPGIRGVDLARELHQHKGHRNLPILLLPSSMDSDDLVRMDNCGMCFHLPKPIRYRQLLQAVNTCLDKQGKPGRRSAASASRALDGQLLLPLNLLVVEDNPINRELAVTILRQQGHRVVEAENGSEGLRRMTQEKFDLVFMDIQMPVMDGLTAVKILRSCEKGIGMPVEEYGDVSVPLCSAVAGTYTPVIALTAHAITGEREKGLAAGMDEYLTKPFQAREIVDILWRFAPEECRQSAESGQPEGWHARSESSMSIPHGATAINMEQVKRHLMETYLIPEEKIDNLLAITVRSFTTQLAALKEACREQDKDRISTAAHTIKGALLNIGQRQWAEVAASIERHKPRDMDEGRVLGWIEQLETGLSRIVEKGTHDDR